MKLIVCTLLFVLVGLESYSQDSDTTKVKVSAARLQSYVGDYELKPGFILKIDRVGEYLMIHPTGQRKSQLHARNENLFFSKVVKAEISFNKDEGGQVTGLTLHRESGDKIAPRL